MATVQKSKNRKIDFAYKADFPEKMVDRKIAVKEERNSIYIPFENVGAFVTLMRDAFRNGNGETKANIMLRLRDGIELMPSIPEKEARRIIKFAQKGVKNPYWLVQDYSIWVAEAMHGRFEGRRQWEDTRELIKVFKEGIRKDNYHVVRGSAIKGILDAMAHSVSLTKEVIPNLTELINEWVNKPKNFGYGGLSNEAQKNNRASNDKLRK